uniref:Uncharacterized protein n=1 Tax=Micrurus carvalhoi TaxID=3147026 RepID=A0A2H6NG85_9SAUR
MTTWLSILQTLKRNPHSGTKHEPGPEASHSVSQRRSAHLGYSQVLVEIEAKKDGNDLADRNPPDVEREQPLVKKRSEDGAQGTKRCGDLFYCSLDIFFPRVLRGGGLVNRNGIGRWRC